MEEIQDGHVGPVKSEVCGHQLRHGPPCDRVWHPLDLMQPERGQGESHHRPDGHSQDVHRAPVRQEARGLERPGDGYTPVHGQHSDQGDGQEASQQVEVQHLGVLQHLHIPG